MQYPDHISLKRGVNGSCSLQFEFPAIERHHLVHVRDEELVKNSAIGLPNIDRFIALPYDRYATQIRRLTYREQPKAVVCFQVASVIVKPRGEFDECSFVICQRIWHQGHFNARIRFVFGRGSCGLIEIFHLERTDEITTSVISSSGQIFAIVIFPVPLRHERVRTYFEFVEVRFVVQNAQ